MGEEGGKAGVEVDIGLIPIILLRRPCDEDDGSEGGTTETEVSDKVVKKGRLAIDFNHDD